MVPYPPLRQPMFESQNRSGVSDSRNVGQSQMVMSQAWQRYFLELFKIANIPTDADILVALESPESDIVEMRADLERGILASDGVIRQVKAELEDLHCKVAVIQEPDERFLESDTELEAEIEDARRTVATIQEPVAPLQAVAFEETPNMRTFQELEDIKRAITSDLEESVMRGRIEALEAIIATADALGSGVTNTLTLAGLTTITVENGRIVATA